MNLRSVKAELMELRDELDVGVRERKQLGRTPKF